jgi:hypothetical protein
MSVWRHQVDRTKADDIEENGDGKLHANKEAFV